MTQLLGRPFLAITLVLIWLLLTSFTLGQLILGLIVAWIAIAAAEPLDLPRPRIHQVRTALRLSWRIFTDIVKSNIMVARMILAGPDAVQHRSGFLKMDIDLRDKTALALLGIVVTGTPGTVWIEFDPDTGKLLLHVLDLRQPDAVRDDIATYARLLKEIFE